MNKGISLLLRGLGAFLQVVGIVSTILFIVGLCAFIFQWPPRETELRFLVLGLFLSLVVAKLGDWINPHSKDIKWHLFVPGALCLASSGLAMRYASKIYQYLGMPLTGDSPWVDASLIGLGILVLLTVGLWLLALSTQEKES